MFIIRTEYKSKINEYEVKGDIAYIKLSKKKGGFVDTKIDAEDLNLVLNKGEWFAEWDKEFNSYLAQNLNYSFAGDKKLKEKQSLHSFILGTNTRTPIRHLNGDTLDNRKCNIKIYDQNAAVNDYENVDFKTIAIILRDKYGRKKEKTLIDREDLDKVINFGYSWVYYLSRGRHYAAANTPNGRIFLHNFLMNPPKDMFTKHITHNTLDNRKSNLENLLLVKETEEVEHS
ncbi:hypothetical protein GOM49_05325 [Clostridium bovifaecis]|uniref:HNH nuclease domain-containing protein n=1 Tax=Clostridium bovifaecis TaxID=2184719 RepID=A0A6I6F1E7_9CLOT|nr:hypothetical protein GOM49_05325 [Clostridium bovifaecis]